jgi:hypothetical protein
MWGCLWVDKEKDSKKKTQNGVFALAGLKRTKRLSAQQTPAQREPKNAAGAVI